MNLLEIRKLFRERSGRYDLVDAAGRDNGANAYLNAGIRYLDRTVEVKKGIGRHFALVSAGSFLHTFTSARAIYEVWVATATERWELKKKDFIELRQLFAEPMGVVERGDPLYYTPALLRPIPEELSAQDITDLGFVADYMDVLTTDNYAYNGVLYAAPPSIDIMLEVIGLFYSKELDADSDTNYWTTINPEMTIAAAMMQIEIDQRNSQGMKDYKAAIDELGLGITKDGIEEDIAGRGQMRG